MNRELNSDTECIMQGDCFSADDFISQSVNEGLFIAEKEHIENTKEQSYFSSFNSFTSSEVEYTFTFDCFFKCGSFDQMVQFSSILRRIHSKLPNLFVENYNELIKNSFPSKKIKGSAEFIRESDFAIKLVTSDNHINIMDIANKLCRCSLENSLFSCFYVQSYRPSNAAVEDRKNSSRVHDRRSIDSLAVFDNGNGNYGVIMAAKNPVRKHHKMLISSPLRGTFISITSSNFMPFSLRIASTSETESADAAIPFPVRQIHLPLCFSASLGCDDSHSSSFMFSTFDAHNETVYLNLVELEICTEKYQYCDPSVVDGTGKCSKYPNHMDVWVDYADTGVAVNKQPGDKLKLNIFSEQDATLSINYDKDVFDSNDCFTFQAISSGINTCSLAVKDNIEDAKQQTHFFNPTSSISSEVEYTLTFDCRFNLGSLDQILESSFKANAKNGASLKCGDTFSASDLNSLKNSGDLAFMNDSNADIINSKSSVLFIPAYFITFDLFALSSDKAYLGVYNSSPSKSDVTIAFLTGFSRKKEKSMLVSTTNLIYQPSAWCLFHTASFTSSPSLSASFSVSLLFSKILLHACNMSSLFDLSSNSYLTAFSRTLDHPISECFFISSFISPETLNFNSAILYSPINKNALELVWGVDSTLLFSYAPNVPLVLSKRISHLGHSALTLTQIDYLNVMEKIEKN